MFISILFVPHLITYEGKWNNNNYQNIKFYWKKKITIRLLGEVTINNNTSMQMQHNVYLFFLVWFF